MHDPNSLREQARKCRVLSKTAVEPEVIEQLRVGQSSWPRKRIRKSGERSRVRCADFEPVTAAREYTAPACRCCKS